jgi:membrane-bound ClpP family serine protease
MGIRIVVTTLLIATGFGTRLAAQDPVVYHIVLSGPVSLEATRVVERAFQVAAEGVGSALVIEIRSSGGRFDAAQLIVAEIDASEVPLYVLVTDRAWGAAALVALAADSLFMVPESSIGAGTEPSHPFGQLSVAAQNAVREDFRSLAKRRGLDSQLVAAMARDGAKKNSEPPLTLSAEDAVEVGLAQGTADNLDSLLAQVDLAGREVITVGPEWTGTTVEIENLNTRDVRIYVLRGGSRYSLGLATSMRLVSFELPIQQLADGARIQVLAEVIGSSDRLLTETIRVEPGLVVRWVLQEPLRYSSYSYFVRQY